MDTKKEQFSLIYDQYIDKIYRFIYLKVSSQEIAEDITSKVFLKGFEAYKNSVTVEPIQNISAFLYQIARNTIVDHYREGGKTKVISADYVPEIADSRTDIHQRAMIRADVDMIKSAIQNIKKEYQDVIIWHYLEDMSAEQIAHIINKPAGTVRVMIHRGLHALRDELPREV